jgi:aminopeptidase-like protein
MEVSEVAQLIRDLFPICRSITGQGVLDTFERLSKIEPLTILKFKTGQKVFDWTIPEEWNVKDAYLKDKDGNKITDFKESNLILVGYSEPYEGWVSLKKLKESHLFSLPEHPTWTPYVTSYYRRTWGFCLPHEQLQKMNDEYYYVKINTELKSGHLHAAELFIKGASKKEVLISANVCHPSLGNNELSGMIVAIYLARLLKTKNNYYSYRFVFVPETIGSIAYLSRNLKKLKKRLVAGFHLTCIGDAGKMSYLTSKNGDCLADRVATHVLKYLEPDFLTHDFLERGSDERQYCSPLVDLPVGSLMRTKYNTYPEYHTSADNENFIAPKYLLDSVSKCAKILEALDRNRTYIATKHGEPHLQKYDLYPSTSTKETIAEVKLRRNILAYCDGKIDLLWLAEKLNVPIYELYGWIDIFLQNRLIRAV